MINKIIAVDFDGTIVEDAYPKIGKPMDFAFSTLNQLQSEGYRLILWTYRHGEKLQEAVDFCKKNGIEFYAVNESFEGDSLIPQEQSRKIHADIFVDDRNLGGFPGWSETYQIIKKKIEFSLDEANQVKYYSKRKTKKKGFLQRLFS